MSELSPKKIALTLQEDIENGTKWRELNTNFKAGILEIVTTVLNTDSPSKDLIQRPDTLVEAKVAASFCFFDGHIRQVLQGETLDNDAMMKVMIQSSWRMKNWLKMRKFLNARPYSLLLNSYNSDLYSLSSQYPVEKEEVPEWKPDIDPELYPIRDALQKRVTDVDEGFQLAMLTLFHMAYNQGIPFLVDSPHFSQREANVITARSFRNTSLEDIHAGETAAAAENFAQLLNESGNKLKNWLSMKGEIDGSPLYYSIISIYWNMYCQEWIEL
jgi:hypothetical protein